MRDRDGIIEMQREKKEGVERYECDGENERKERMQREHCYWNHDPLGGIWYINESND